MQNEVYQRIVKLTRYTYLKLVTLFDKTKLYR